MKLNSQAPEIIEVENSLSIDVQKLLDSLEVIKAKKLTEKEQYYLCRSLLGDEPIEIARMEYYDRFSFHFKKDNPNLSDDDIKELVEKRIKIKAAHIRSSMSITINSYVSELMYAEEESEQWNRDKRPNWLKVVCFLRNKGYKKSVILEQNSQN